ncbi:hypothetical protein D3C87_1759260 [compost metagenome]
MTVSLIFLSDLSVPSLNMKRTDGSSRYAGSTAWNSSIMSSKVSAAAAATPVTAVAAVTMPFGWLEPVPTVKWRLPIRPIRSAIAERTVPSTSIAES